eukprot:2687912-Alexandrium_andersonii.AAC.1
MYPAGPRTRHLASCAPSPIASVSWDVMLWPLRALFLRLLENPLALERSDPCAVRTATYIFNQLGRHAVAPARTIPVTLGYSAGHRMVRSQSMRT